MCKYINFIYNYVHIYYYIYIYFTIFSCNETRIVSRKINVCGEEISEKIVEIKNIAIVNNPVRHASYVRQAAAPQERLRNANASRVIERRWATIAVVHRYRSSLVIRPL